MRKKYVYKCVRTQAHKKFCSVSPPSDSLYLNYSLNKWAKAFNGTVGIFVFKTLRAAKNWSAYGTILKCEYKGEPIRLIRRMDFSYAKNCFGLKTLVSIFSTPDKRERMLKRVNGGYDSTGKGFKNYKVTAPYDTHVVNAVKPVRVVRKSKHFSLKRFTEGKGLPEWMTNKWRLKR